MRVGAFRQALQVGIRFPVHRIESYRLKKMADRFSTLPARRTDLTPIIFKYARDRWLDPSADALVALGVSLRR